MRERAKKLNGTLEIRTAPRRGTSIIVSLPATEHSRGTRAGGYLGGNGEGA
jgi:nitrate/nitrite-specific signal transduction histidine kinase